MREKKNHDRFLTQTLLAIVLLTLVCLPDRVDAGERRILEHKPERVQQVIEMHFQRLGEYLPRDEKQGEYPFVVEVQKAWNPGETIRVAFLGGSAELHGKIAEAASEWTEYANLKLDFGVPGAFRQWSTSDLVHSAEIRISFSDMGYWSVVGVEAMVLKPGESSMNLQDFDSDLPEGWREIVLHEFGHALGFLHEHQHPEGTCDKEFRWYDDRGYVRKENPWGEFVENNGKRPGIYTVLGGAPNFWDKQKVDHNLRKLSLEHAFEIGPFDNQSIMKYFFPDWMFHNPKNSKCYSEIENRKLSNEDKKGARKVYPSHPTQVREILEAKSRVYESMLANPKLPADLHDYIKNRLGAIKALLLAQ